MFEWLELDDWGKWDKENPLGYVEQVFRIYALDGNTNHFEDMDQFDQRWGGFNKAACLRALKDGEEDDRCAAYYLLTCLGIPELQKILWAAQASTSTKERWCSAFCLAELKDERVKSRLYHMLTEFLPTPDHPQTVNDTYWFESRRSEVLRALRQWRSSINILAISKALQQAIIAEKYLSSGVEAPLRYFEDLLAYELGYHGVFSMIPGITMGNAHQHMAYMFAAIGEYETEMMKKGIILDRSIIKGIMMNAPGLCFIFYLAALSSEQLKALSQPGGLSAEQVLEFYSIVTNIIMRELKLSQKDAERYLASCQGLARFREA
jgi:hypothetical protein